MECIVDGTEEKTFWICPNRKHLDEEKTNEKIPKFYSYKHMHDEGWRVTKDKRFSERGNMVAVCPECVKEFEKENKFNWK
ncbi:hypothetical protein KAR91_62960 [Candidatus Pacearchaeota archaeon]|nr:hypothetical protein [Candidatus Pacearchaeota archaeon]